MKTSLKFSIFLAAALSMGLFVAFDPVNEKDAIRAVIEKETSSYFVGDMDAWVACFKHDDGALYVGSPLGGTSVLQGWDAIDDNVGKPRRALPNPWRTIIQRDNWQIRQSGKTAFVTYDQTLRSTDWPGTSQTKEIRCLEKVNGDWKIVVLNWIDRTQLDNDAQREAIKTVIAAETDAYFNHDYDKWAACWMQNKGASATWNNDNRSVGQTIGFEELAATTKENMKEDKAAFSVTRDNWAIEITGNLAMVRFDQHFTDAKGKTFLSKEYRLMYWDGNAWKIYQVNAFWDYKNAK